MDCQQFLQWALEKLEFRYKGFHKVRNQVCKRIHKRMRDLNLLGFEEYQSWLNDNADEWIRLDTMCQITISKFYRDKGLFEYLRKQVFPELINRVTLEKRSLNLWSAGCASGEEAYTLAMILYYDTPKFVATGRWNILASDINPNLLERGGCGCYPYSSVKDLPESWKNHGFYRNQDNYCIQEHLRKAVDWCELDIRKELPHKKFDLICCRNLVATYFSTELQIKIFKQLHQRLYPGAYLILGIHEWLPSVITELELVHSHNKIYQRLA